MKRILLIASSVLLALIFASSCLKDTTGTYSFGMMYQTNIADTAKCNQILNYCKTVEYFNTLHSYTGTYSECCQKSAEDFLNATPLLEEDRILSLLGPSELFRIMLVGKDYGDIIAYITWSSDKTEESETEEI